MRLIALALVGCGGQDAGNKPDCSDPVRWSCDVGPMFDTYCVSCHAADPPGDFRDYSVVAPLADEVACGVATAAIRPADCGDDWPPAEQFPAGGGPHPSDAERQELVDWVAAGAPE